ncbi:MAG: hypothetical protein RR563_11990 [Acinetobacter sp.]
MFITPTFSSIIITSQPLTETEEFNLHDMHRHSKVGESKVMLRRYTIPFNNQITVDQIEHILDPLKRSPGTSYITCNGEIPANFVAAVNNIVNQNIAQYNSDIALINRNYDIDD